MTTRSAIIAIILMTLAAIATACGDSRESAPPAASSPSPLAFAPPTSPPAPDTPTPEPTAAPDTPTSEPAATPAADTPTPESTVIPTLAADTPTLEPTAAPDTPTPEPTAAPAADTPTPEPTPIPPPAPYDSNRAMRDVFPGFGLTGALMYDTLDVIAARKDRSLVPVLVEMMRFMPSPSARDAVARTLAVVTGQAFSGDEWDLWMEWLGANLADYQPPSDYVAWKEDLYFVIDPRFARFLRPAREFSRIDPTEIVWGGVLPDGIPDLRNPQFQNADEQTFMNPEDRVFGVEINGDARAYPLRIVNAHEMVNDVVGGEPVSLMW